MNIFDVPRHGSRAHYLLYNNHCSCANCMLNARRIKKRRPLYRPKSLVACMPSCVWCMHVPTMRRARTKTRRLLIQLNRAPPVCSIRFDRVSRTLNPHNIHLQSWNVHLFMQAKNSNSSRRNFILAFVFSIILWLWIYSEVGHMPVKESFWSATGVNSSMHFGWFGSMVPQIIKEPPNWVWCPKNSWFAWSQCFWRLLCPHPTQI